MENSMKANVAIKILVLVHLLSLGTLLTGCASQPMPIPAADSDVAQLYQQKCSACHALPHPTRNTYVEWQHLVEVMQQRMKEKHMPPLDASEKTQILSYLKQYSRQ
ncbi:MAG: hypothetical protein D6698_05580 [Gammaproteobacteria bacterium]|nr:MAG: hypothetical protein D6698_05580 [Gammaproteobacteria bacterium]